MFIKNKVKLKKSNKISKKNFFNFTKIRLSVYWKFFSDQLVNTMTKSSSYIQYMGIDMGFHII